MAHAATTTHRHQTSHHPQPRASNKGSYTQEPWEEERAQRLGRSLLHLTTAEELDDWEEEADLKTFLAGESDWIHRDVLDSDTLDSYVEEECSADKNLYEVYLGYKEARDTLIQVRRGRGFWPVIAIPAPDGKSNSKGKGDPLKQRLVSRTQCGMCGEEGHWEEDCPQAHVDMPQAKSRATFSRPHVVGVGVSQARCVEAWTVSQSTENAKTRLKSWTSQEMQESTKLMGVTMTMPEGHAMLDSGAALDCCSSVHIINNDKR